MTPVDELIPFVTASCNAGRDWQGYADDGDASSGRAYDLGELFGVGKCWGPPRLRSSLRESCGCVRLHVGGFANQRYRDSRQHQHGYADGLHR